MNDASYELVRLRNGAVSVRSAVDGETMHPAIGPAAEAEQLYVRQLHLSERLAVQAGEFVVWDVGLGAAANALAVLRATGRAGGEQAPGPGRSLRLVSFDHTLEPLRFGLQHAAELGYLAGFEAPLDELLTQGLVRFALGGLTVHWQVHEGDFPALLSRSSRGYEPQPSTEPGKARHSVGTAGLPADDGAHGVTRPTSQPASTQASEALASPLDVGYYGRSTDLPAPHAILFDPFSPAKNPAMWTASLFSSLFHCLDPQRPCSLATYSRSTMIRASLLLAGFFVGAGPATGQKEETTIAANTFELLAEPLDRRWLERARRSDSAEPLWDPVYRRAKLGETTWERLRQHPQFESR